MSNDQSIFQTNHQILSFLIFFFFIENFFLSDPEVEDTIPSYYMSHKEKYEESIRKAVVVSTKIRNLSKKGMDGIDNYT